MTAYHTLFSIVSNPPALPATVIGSTLTYGDYAQRPGATLAISFLTTFGDRTDGIMITCNALDTI